MRCQKVRYCLSAYCKNELTARERIAIGDHVRICESCRQEEATVRSLQEAMKALPPVNLKVDFNARLLGRISEERFAETRSKAYFPRRSVVPAWRQYVPALVTVSLVLVVAVSVADRFIGNPEETNVIANRQHDESWQTVQPMLHKDWSLREQLARAERTNRISGQLTSGRGFGVWYVTPSQQGTLAGSTVYVVPAPETQVRPVIRTFESAPAPAPEDSRPVY